MMAYVNRTVFALLAVWLFLSEVNASAQIKSMKLLSQQVGWAATEHNVFWTVDAGKHWNDVTPKAGKDEAISSVFFLDDSRGWVLLVGSGGGQGARFALASTTNAGSTWQILPVKVPTTGAAGRTTGGGRIDFIDAKHGWINLDVASSSAFSLGMLLITEDGGNTWALAPGGSGTGGYIQFVSQDEGWAVSLNHDELYVTRDGAKSWQGLSLEAPPGIRPAVHPTYDQPVFRDPQHGFLPVTFSGPGNSALVFFETSDGGRMWKPYGLLPGLPPSSIGQAVPSAVVDGTLLAASTTGTVLTLATLPRNGELLKTSAHPFHNKDAVVAISFATTAEGWVLTSRSLLATLDQGRTWIDITPGGREAELLPQNPPMEPRQRTASAPAANFHISTHLGFDQSFVALRPRAVGSAQHQNSGRFYSQNGTRLLPQARICWTSPVDISYS